MLPLKWAIGWITEMVQLFFLLNQFHRTFTKNCLNLTLYNCLSLGTAAPWSTFIYLSLISDWWKISHLHIWGTQIVLLPGNFDVEYPGELQNKQLLMHAEYKIQGNKVQQLMTSRSSCRATVMSQNGLTCSSLNFSYEKGRTGRWCSRRDYRLALSTDILCLFLTGVMPVYHTVWTLKVITSLLLKLAKHPTWFGIHSESFNPLLIFNILKVFIQDSSKELFTLFFFVRKRVCVGGIKISEANYAVIIHWHTQKGSRKDATSSIKEAIAYYPIMGFELKDCLQVSSKHAVYFCPWRWDYLSLN